MPVQRYRPNPTSRFLKFHKAIPSNGLGIPCSCSRRRYGDDIVLGSGVVSGAVKKRSRDDCAKGVSIL